MNKITKRSVTTRSAPQCCGQPYSGIIRTNAKLDLKIFNLPDCRFFKYNELIKSSRILEVLRQFKINEHSFIIENPFTYPKIIKWICENSKFISYNDLHETDYKYLYSTSEVIIEFLPHVSIAKLQDGVFFFTYRETYIDQQNSHTYIIFVEKHQRNKDFIRKFIINFSKKLQTIKLNQKNNEQAFNSIFLSDNILEEIKSDIESFLSSRKIYKEDLNLSWKRGYMLIGPPGNGKTLLIRKICEYYGLEYFDIKRAIQRDGSINMDEAKSDHAIDNLLFPEEQKPKVCILEDIDKFTAFQSGESDDRDYAMVSLHALLKGLDGVDQYDGIILIATSNFPDVLHEALVGRPGRFDKIIEIKKPTIENICKLLQYYKITIKDSNLEYIAKELLGSSMAFVTEFVKICKMKYKSNVISLEQGKEILKAIKQHQELCKNHFSDKKKVGFLKE
jgi:AAA+ superfamily predicted ATPase